MKGVEGHNFIVFHALERENGPRRMCVHRIEFTDDGVPVLPGRPNTGKRLRMGGEYEDDLKLFGGVVDEAPVPPSPAASGSNHQGSSHHHGDELKALAGGLLGGSLMFGKKKEKKHKKDKKHKKNKSDSSSSSSSDSD